MEESIIEYAGPRREHSRWLAAGCICLLAGMASLGLMLTSWYIMLTQAEQFFLPRDVLMIVTLAIGPFLATFTLGSAMIMRRSRGASVLIVSGCIPAGLALLLGIVAPWGWFLFVPAVLLGIFAIRLCRKFALRGSVDL